MNGSAASASRPELTIDPPAAKWPSLPDAGTAGDRHDLAAATRTALGLDPAAPVIMSGHQPTLWHPGILAKRLAMAAAARRSDAQAAWVLVDQDEVDPWRLDVPTRDPSGLLGAAPASLGPEPRAGAPASELAAIEPELALPAQVEELAQARLSHAAEVLASHRGAQDAALQIEQATGSMIGDAPVLVRAIGLCRTPIAAWFIEQMLEDPGGCALAYNRAAARHGGARALVERGGDWELPFWRLGGQRTPVFASELRTIARDRLAPRALCMTAMLRLAACDLFIHGKGGGATGSSTGYDRATEAWIEDWLGDTLAPAVVVSADLRLPLEEGEPVTTRPDRQRAVNRAHSAGHNPSLVGDEPGQRTKRLLVERIGHAEDPRERAEGFRALHEFLASHRRVHADEIAALRLRAANAPTASRRDWSFVLYPEASITALRSAIEECWC